MIAVGYVIGIVIALAFWLVCVWRGRVIRQRMEEEYQKGLEKGYEDGRRWERQFK